MSEVTIRINGKQLTVPEDATILTAAKSAGVEIPTLCHHQDIHTPEVYKESACRVCMVEVSGESAPVPSCVTHVEEGMDIVTDNRKINQARKVIVEAQLANHYTDCGQCVRMGECELRTVAEELGINNIESQGKTEADQDADDSNQGIVLDPNKCILCGRCVRVCNEVQSAGILQFYDGTIENGLNPPFSKRISPPWEKDLADTSCVECGQCSTVCPVAGITEKTHESSVYRALKDPDKHVVVQTAPAIRVSIGEEFGLSPGEISTGQMVMGLRELGFDKVFDTVFTADLTIMEEGYEFIDRLNNNGKLPMFSSCSPGWVKFMEHNYPEYLDHLSTCKSPQQMLGTLAKTYYAEQMDVDPEDIYVVSLMPCTAKKFEAARSEMSAHEGVQDVDAVLTTREYARMLKEQQIDLANLDESDYDKPLGISTGAGAIFGATGGVMEAALRTAVEVITGEELDRLNFTQVRGYEGIKGAELDVGGVTVKVAVVHGLSNARKVMELISRGELFYHFIEVMTCPGGCIGGGGQPLPATYEKRTARIGALYQLDENTTLRKSHENPAVQKLYQDFLGEPNGERSHELLHTEYQHRKQPITAYSPVKDLNSLNGEGRVESDSQSGQSSLNLNNEKFTISNVEELSETIKEKTNGSHKSNGKLYKKPLFNEVSSQDNGRKFEYLIVNGTSAGDIGSYDHRYLIEYSSELLDQLNSLIQEYQISKCYLGIDVSKPDALSVYTDKLRQNSDIEVIPLIEKYPKDYEHYLIKNVIDRNIPSEKSPTEYGILVLNVEELFVSKDTLEESQTLRKRVVTVDGPAVDSPGNYLIELGTSVSKVLELCSNTKENLLVYIDGKEVLNPDENYISSETGSIIVYPQENGLSHTKNFHLKAFLDCVRCGKCVENCPSGLYPSEIANNVQIGHYKRAEVLGLSECIGCSVCAYLCPSNRPIPDIISRAQNELSLDLQ